MPVEIQETHAWCAKTAPEDWPYSYGGGHPDSGTPSVGSNGLRGYDCSGAVSGALHAGGMLGAEAEGTRELQNWGLSGAGEWMTLFVINNMVIDHTVLYFPLSEPDKMLFQAAKEGTTVGWVPAEQVTGLVAWLRVTGFHERRRS